MKKAKKDKTTENARIVKNRLILLSAILVLIIMTICIFANQTIRENIAKNLGIDIQNAEENQKETKVFEDGSTILTDDSAIVSSANIANRTTGTGPFDANDEPGNDSSAENNVVRSFDKVTWEIEANMEVNSTGHGSVDANTYSKFRGGSIYIEARLPEENKGLMKWSLEDMKWADETGVVSEDGLTFTAQYKMAEDVLTVPGKQTLSVVLSVLGAGNGTELNPTFKLWMQGNESNKENEGYEAIEIGDSGEKVSVSAKGGYNIQISPNTGACSVKTSVDFGQGEVSGRMYGYGVILQLYNEDKNKGLKGMEYPKGDINFDINVKLEAEETIDGKKVKTDITDLATPQLWNYKINIGSTVENPAYGNIPNRNMYFGINTAHATGYAPYGMAEANRTNSIYNSGEIYMEQTGKTIKTTINNYEFDGIFPKYNQWYDSSKPNTVYTDNIGCFSVGYFQVFVPDNEATDDENKQYYFSVESTNMNVTTNSGENVTNQKILTDDIYRIQHFNIKPGIYSQSIILMDDHTRVLNSELRDAAGAAYHGKGRKSKGHIFEVQISVGQDESNDIGTEIWSVNKFIRFDGTGLEPQLQDNRDKIYIQNTESESEYKAWYLTKKDGSDWISQQERNTANIKDLNIYEELEDIPDGYICVGMYIEMDMLSVSKSAPTICIRFKIKDTAKVGKTYGITQNSDYWIEKLDRSTQTITNPDAIYPEPTWSQGTRDYKNVEFNENGEKIEGTHQSMGYGNSLLVAGAESSIKMTPMDNETQAEKTIYDLGKNENEVTFKLEPKLEEIDKDNPVGVKGATITIKDTLGKGLSYIPGSSNYGEPIEKLENEDGTTTLKFEKYNCNVGEDIEPLTFKARIDPKTQNGTKITNTAVIEPDREKIGLTEISLRRATSEIDVVNLGSQRLFKETDNQIIENNGEIRYKIHYQTNNKTPDFQLIDVLPYNGDGRGSAYNGTYTLESVNIKQEGEKGVIDNSNLRLYTTTDIEARKISPKDDGIGIDEIWKEKEIGGKIGEPVTVLALKGVIEEKTTVEVEVVIKTNNNKGGDIYENSATAQTSKETEVITTTNVETKVVKREIEGKIWYDTNENGIKDDEESYANRIEMELKKADGSKATDINGNEIPNILTNEKGEYVFSNLPQGEYKVEIHTEDKYKLTITNIGSNKEINSKFTENENGQKESYLITNLNSIGSPEIIEKNVNAGLVVKDAKIIVKYLEEDNTPQTDEDNKVLKEQREITQYEKEGNLVNYKIGDNYETQAEKIENYIMLRNSGNTRGTLVGEETIVIYYYTYNKQDIEITKVWEDNKNEAGKRPTSIKVTLKNGKDTVKEVILSEENKMADEEKEKIEGISNTAEVWKTTIEDVAIYDEKGQKIEYTIDEKEEQGSLESYNKTINGMQITNTFTQNTEKIEIPVTKVWEDNENKAGKRPDSVTLILKREISNTLLGNNSTENGSKEEKRYVEVTRQTINGIDNQGENANEWKYTFGNIAKYDENNDEINYIVEEIVPDFYTSKVEKVENTEGENNTTGFKISNTFDVPDEKINVEITKIWNDNNNRAGKRPEKVTLVLTGKNTEGEMVVDGQEITLTQANAVDGTESDGRSTSTIWKGTIENLPKYDENADIINYELSEKNLNNVFYTKENTTINQQTKTVTNKFEVPNEKIEIEVNKKWEDNNNELGKRPESVKLYVTGNNQEYEIELTEANKRAEDENVWSGKIGNLPKYDVNGDEIKYTLDERPIASEFYSKAGIEQESKTVTNKFEIPTENVQIGVSKIWEDNNNKRRERPESIVLQIKKKGTEEIVTEELVQGNRVTDEGWGYIFEVPKYDEEGNIVEYEIGEKEIGNKFYPEEEKRIDQEKKTITNVYKVPDEKIEITVNKEWEDNEIQEARRPENIILIVNKKIDGQTGEKFEEVARQEISQANKVEGNKDKWSYTFTNLARYNEEGEEIEYTVDEVEKTAGDLKFYTPNVGEVTDIENVENKKQVTITNTFTKPTDTTAITVTKKWEDEEDKYGKRPESIKVQVKSNGIVVASQEITTKNSTVENKNEWTYTFTNLGKYDENGQEIVYKVDEEELVGEGQIYYTKDIEGTTISNRMTKTPGTVFVKYKDKYTDEEISTQVEKEGVVGETYSVEADKKEIAGYTLIEEPEEKEGVFKNEPQEKVYYYAKNTEVVVKYLEKDGTETNTDNKVVATQEIISGYEGKGYTTEQKTVSNYTFVEVSGGIEGNMEREGTEVIYYYAANTKVTVNYLEEDETPGDNSDNTVLKREIIEGYEGTEYTTEKKEIEGYTFVKVVGKTEGVMTKEGTEVNYYYAKNTQVMVKYVEQDKTPENNSDNMVLDTKRIEGYVGKEYQTEQKEIQGYTFVGASDNTKGIMTKEEIEVYYYYAQNTSIKVQYIDKTTGEILEEVIKEGKVGDICKTEAITIPGYILVEEPENTEIEMTKEQQVVKYYYLKQVEGVIERHVDIISGEVLEEKAHTGKVGDKYKIEAKEFKGYDLVESKLPDNAEGEMTTEVVEVTYYYIKQASVRVEYLEKGTGKKVAEDTIINGHEGDKYETKEKEIKGYNLKEKPKNATGKMEVTLKEDGGYNTETIVKYYYVKEAGGVHEKHIDIDSGAIISQELHAGSVGDKYEIKPKEIKGYDLVIEDEEGNSKLPQNAKGAMTEELIEVTYYYQKLSVVRVEYIDKYTGEKITEEKIEGHRGEKYKTEIKEIEGYDIVKEELPENAEGKMTKEEIVVKYYYQRKAKIEIQYIEKETGYIVAETEIIEGHEGDEYETKGKEIQYYRNIENSGNTKGKMSKEKITVTYYYEKKTFNLELNTWISRVSIDGVPQIGQSYENKDELYKIDIHRNKINSSDVKVTYTIRITNTGEIEGTANKITEIIPQGFYYSANDNKTEWREEGGTLVTEELQDIIIQPGESEEIEIVLRWSNREDNLGEMKNIAVISGVTNPARYTDMVKQDNSDTSQMLITIETGGLDSRDRTIVLIAGIQIVILLTAGIIFGRTSKKKKRK